MVTPKENVTPEQILREWWKSPEPQRVWAILRSSKVMEGWTYGKFLRLTKLYQAEVILHVMGETSEASLARYLEIAASGAIGVRVRARWEVLDAVQLSEM